MRDIAASILARLKNQAKETELSYQMCLQLFCQEDVTNSLIKDSDLSDIKTFGYKSKCWKYEKKWRYSCLPARRGK